MLLLQEAGLVFCYSKGSEGQMVERNRRSESCNRASMRPVRETCVNLGDCDSKTEEGNSSRTRAQLGADRSMCYSAYLQMVIELTSRFTGQVILKG